MVGIAPTGPTPEAAGLSLPIPALGALWAALSDGGWLAYCFVDGFDLSENMVHTGWALTARRYCSHYSATEERAKAAKRGRWKGEFTAPWDWRASRKQ